MQTLQAKLLDVDAAAQLLSISPWTVRAWAYKGKLSSLKLGKRLLFEPDAIAALIASCKGPAQPGGEANG